jgi:RNA polymerase II subunit A C-terminal domain phosphatase SSU72
MAEPKRFAMVCAANMNRSMEAHRVLLERGLDVKSYGAGNHVKLPGASRDNPNVFSFGVESYQQIYDALMEQGASHRIVSHRSPHNRVRGVHAVP